jgi:dolichol-phosphate mannosyltransferase
MNKNEMLVLIPTYNEKDNVEKLCEELQGLNLKTDILFIDDNSPDGTGQILDGLSQKYDNVKVLHRPGKLGIGTAHKYGINWAYDNNYPILITMDCDFTHPPSYIPELIRNSTNYDIVVASRYILKDGLIGWSLYRKALTSIGHIMTRTLLGMKYDATGAFRLYKLNRINRNIFGLVSSSGYSFFFESLYIMYLNNFPINEIPIKAPLRTFGNSKMRFKDILGSLTLVFKLYFTTLFNKKRLKLPED